MKNIFSFLLPVLTVFTLLCAPLLVEAQVYTGPGLKNGAEQFASQVVPNSTDFRSTAIRYIDKIMTYVALIGVIVIIAGGIMMIFSQGKEETKDKVKNMIVYLAIGVVIILLAKGAMKVFVDIANSSS